MTAILVVWVVFPVGLVLVWAIFRGHGYKRVPLDTPPGQTWVPTGEVFADPRSGNLIQVWSEPVSGERAYVRARPGLPRR